MYGARGVANTSFMGRTGLKKPDFRLWHAIARTNAVFLALRGGYMSVELVRWAKKVGDFLSTPSGTQRQRACPLVTTDMHHMAVERAPAPLRLALCTRARRALRLSLYHMYTVHIAITHYRPPPAVCCV